MTIDKLIALLETYRDQLGGDTEVRMMTQQHWPLEATLFGCVDSDTLYEYSDDDADDECPDECVYLLEGKQLAYGTQGAWDLAARDC